MTEYYLYRHIRLDKNEPFYIGRGSKEERSMAYARAICKKRRSSAWKDVFDKSEIRVDIVFKSFSKDCIVKKETEFINLYGRIFNNTGTLVNLSTCNGMTGYVHTESAKMKIKQKKIGVKTKSEFIPVLIAASTQKKKIIQLDLNGNFIKEWESSRQIERDLGFRHSVTLNVCRTKEGTTHKSNQKTYQAYGFKWEYKKEYMN